MSTTSSSSSTTTTTSSSSSGTPSDDERPGLDEQPLHDDNELNRELHQEEHTNEEQKPPEPAPPAQPTQQPAQKPKPRQKRKDDFILGTVLGQGAFGQGRGASRDHRHSQLGRIPLLPRGEIPHSAHGHLHPVALCGQ